MAFSVSYPTSLTQPESFEDANPWVSAVNSINAIRQAQLNNQATMQQNQYRPEMLQNQVLQGQLTNQKSQAEQPYWGQQAAATLAHTQAETPYLQANTANVLEETKYIPEKYRQQAIAQKLRQAEIDNTLAGLGVKQGNLALRAQTSATGGAAIGADNSGQLATGATNAVARALGVPAAPVNPDAVQAVRDAAASNALKKIQTAQQANQQLFANNVEQQLTKVEPDLPDIVKFASVVGQSKKTVDQYLAAANKDVTDPAYQKFNNFVNVDVPILGNEIRRALGANASNEEQAAMRKALDPVTWRNNPQLALSQMNYLIRSVRANEASLARSPAQNLQALRASSQRAPLNLNVNPSAPSYTQEDLEFTAKKRNMTVDQVKQELKRRGQQ